MNKLMRIFRHFIHIISITVTPSFIRSKMKSCREIAILIANSDQNSKATKLQIKVHTLMCQSCFDYSKQLEMIKLASEPLKEVSLTDDQIESINKSKEELLKKYR